MAVITSIRVAVRARPTGGQAPNRALSQRRVSERNQKYQADSARSQSGTSRSRRWVMKSDNASFFMGILANGGRGRNGLVARAC